MSIYLIEHTHGGQYVQQADLDRATAAADKSLAAHGITTPAGFAAAAAAFDARIEMEPHDAALADAFEAAKQEANRALTSGWHNPDGAEVWLVPHATPAQ